MSPRLVGAATVAAVAAVISKPYLEQLIHRLTATVKLQYFDLAGLGEPIRYALAQAGVPFEDARFASRDEFLAEKPRLRFGQVPYLIVNGHELFQSCAIMRFIGRYFSAALYPLDATKAAQVDALLDQVKDVRVGLDVAKYKMRFGFPDTVLDDAKAQIVIDTWRTSTLPRHLEFFEKALAASPSAFLTGSPSPTVADIFLATTLHGFAQMSPPPAPYSAKLQALVEAVYAQPAIVAFRDREQQRKSK